MTGTRNRAARTATGPARNSPCPRPANARPGRGPAAVKPQIRTHSPRPPETLQNRLTYRFLRWLSQVGLASCWRRQGPVHSQFVLHGNWEADTEVRMQEHFSDTGIEDPVPGRGGWPAVDGTQWRTVQAQPCPGVRTGGGVASADAVPAWRWSRLPGQHRARRGVLPVTSGLEDVQDGLRPQAEIKGGEANPVPRSTAARWRSMSSAVASPWASSASWSWSKLERSSAPTAGSDTGM